VQEPSCSHQHHHKFGATLREANDFGDVVDSPYRKELVMKNCSLHFRLGVIAILLFAGIASAQVALVADLNTGPSVSVRSGIEEIVSVSASKAYFIACDDEFGCEVWKTDGSSRGTVRISDICPGACFEFDPPSDLTRAGNRVYFSGDDGQRGEEPWMINIDTDAVTLVADLESGSASSSPKHFTYVQNLNGGALFFSQMHTGFGGNRRSRITRISAGRITNTDTALEWDPFTNWVVYGRAMYGVAKPIGANNFELHKASIDVLSEISGAAMVLDIEPGLVGSRIRAITTGLVPTKLLFVANSAAAGSELYASDGTAAGTAIIKEQRAKSKAQARRALCVAMKSAPPLCSPIFRQVLAPRAASCTAQTAPPMAAIWSKTSQIWTDLTQRTCAYWEAI
jgi:ELWxxDGT repeat protein